MALVQTDETRPTTAEAGRAMRPPKTGKTQLNVLLPLDVVLMVDDYSVSTGMTRVRIVELALLRFLN